MHISNWIPPGTQEDDAAEVQDRRILGFQIVLLAIVAVAFVMAMACDYPGHNLACVAQAAAEPC